ncbi:dihydrofolate reductase [Blastococcus sp. TF02-8]|uniref:dihydrofolate reductase family protein n=1 Tax=Blastococcus sp. TF02-8 TaxID=2250574 RepID=UPI000DEBC84A|nr:dihydrofolate reductase family protein [Blastococcus sp. TF02-8]RBY96118.1 dihydrofolate reductase [Blastococcus sp. TF02-8]
MLTYCTATTLDGFIADPDDSLDWLLRQKGGDSGSFDFDTFLAGVGATVMGSTTYEWVTGHLHGTVEAWPYAVPSWVMTRRSLPAVHGADIRFASGDVRPVFEAMTAAAGGKALWVVGGGDLAGQFAEAGLLDEVVVSIAPVTLGAGRPLLPRRLDLELAGTAANGAFVCARYRVAGPLLEDRS